MKAVCNWFWKRKDHFSPPNIQQIALLYSMIHEDRYKDNKFFSFNFEETVSAYEWCLINLWGQEGIFIPLMCIFHLYGFHLICNY